MTKSKTETDELAVLQKEALELRESKSEPPPPDGEDAEDETDPGSAELTTQIDQFIREVEELATQKPALALLAALGLGILIGQALSRR
jgi:hypothetical protein